MKIFVYNTRKNFVKVISFACKLCLILGLHFNTNYVLADNLNYPVAIDSRMKTLVYNPHEIFQLKFIVNFQSVIRFEKGEDVQLISFGNALPWNVLVAHNNIYIKALDPDVKTNMLVTTNKREYAFDISSSDNANVYDDQVVYTVNFFYPEVDVDKPQPFKIRDITIDAPLSVTNEQKKDVASINFYYTFAGTGDQILPIRVFDNGKQTFFQFPNANAIVPAIYSVGRDGRETRLAVKLVDGYVVIDGIEYQVTLRWGKQLICIFNEMLLKVSDSGKVLVRAQDT